MGMENIKFEMRDHAKDWKLTEMNKRRTWETTSKETGDSPGGVLMKSLECSQGLTMMLFDHVDYSIGENKQSNP